MANEHGLLPKADVAGLSDELAHRRDVWFDKAYEDDNLFLHGKLFASVGRAGSLGSEEGDEGNEANEDADDAVPEPRTIHLCQKQNKKQTRNTGGGGRDWLSNTKY